VVQTLAAVGVGLADGFPLAFGMLALFGAPPPTTPEVAMRTARVRSACFGGDMPVPFIAIPDERSGFALFLDEQRRAILSKLDGLTDEQAASRPTASAFCLLTLVKHVAFVERRWMQLEVARRDIPGLWPPPDDRELHLEDGDTLASVRALYEGIIDENRRILDAVSDLDEVSPATGLNRRWVLLHLVEELARHAGHADILRESIDGATGV
jgi:uncharacterized damage-inducible protein DinB